jgi:hypothetical protein
MLTLYKNKQEAEEHSIPTSFLTSRPLVSEYSYKNEINADKKPGNALRMGKKVRLPRNRPEGPEGVDV